MSSVVQDPVGDAAPPYMDIHNVKITEQRGSGRLYLLMQLASRVPKQPSDPSWLFWSWYLDTDKTTSPSGGIAEFTVHVRWDGTTFSAFLVDRRPLLTGGNLIITPVPFSVNGATVKAFVDLSAIGHPSSFDWFAGTKVQPGIPDFAPNSGLASWTR